ncbi:hypothetical protein SMQE22_02200 [Serratia marcescens]|nr:hypothetical protein SMQE22_02200 [Serratia marcescens]
MIVLRKVYARNYKAYKELILDISKYNILIGKNSAGKSAITRLVPFLINSLNVQDGGVLDLSPLGIDIAATFSDIVYGHSEFTKMELGADFLVNNSYVGFSTEVAYSTELKDLFVSKFSMRMDSKLIFEASIDLECLGSDNVIRYVYDSTLINLKFTGLIPETSSIDDSFGENITAAFSLLNEVKKNNFNLSYLGPFRKDLLRTFTIRKINSYNVGIKGEFSPYVFMEKEIKSNGVLGNKIKEWMQQCFNGKYFSVKFFEKSFSIYCNGLGQETNIIDEGMGFAQIFPSIINRNVRDLDKTKGIEIVEQPELHMHPAACGAIADLYLSAIKNNIVFIETHSKEFLLRVRRRVAEGIDKDDINIVYIDGGASNGGSNVNIIKLDEKGGVEWWPTGIFEEDFDEVMALSRAGR